MNIYRLTRPSNQHKHHTRPAWQRILLQWTPTDWHGHQTSTSITRDSCQHWLLTVSYGINHPTIVINAHLEYNADNSSAGLKAARKLQFHILQQWISTTVWNQEHNYSIAWHSTGSQKPPGNKKLKKMFRKTCLWHYWTFTVIMERTV